MTLQTIERKAYVTLDRQPDVEIWYVRFGRTILATGGYQLCKRIFDRFLY